jgi:methionyl-tRNA formyltransferase
MIKTIIEKDPQPEEQRGEPVNFKRRKPEDGDISDLNDLDKVYDYIRMLDCEGYPPAFLETEHFCLEFSRASLKADKSIKADVRITKK